MAAVAVRSVNPNGTVSLEDGRSMQLVVAASGVLGVRPIKNDDLVAGLDQVGPPPGFDVSGLDQTGPPPPLPTS